MQGAIARQAEAQCCNIVEDVDDQRCVIRVQVFASAPRDRCRRKMEETLVESATAVR
jgi:hypothetical protein